MFCLMLAKSHITQKYSSRIDEAVRDGNKQSVVWIPWDNDITLRPASYKGLSDMPQLGLLWLCWDHLAGVKVQRVPAPGLVRGQG